MLQIEIHGTIAAEPDCPRHGHELFAISHDADLILTRRQTRMQVLTSVVGLNFKMLSDTLSIDRNGDAGHRLPIRVGHFPMNIPGLCKGRNGHENRDHEEKQDFVHELH